MTSLLQYYHQSVQRAIPHDLSITRQVSCLISVALNINILSLGFGGCRHTTVARGSARCKSEWELSRAIQIPHDGQKQSLSIPLSLKPAHLRRLWWCKPAIPEGGRERWTKQFKASLICIGHSGLRETLSPKKNKEKIARLASSVAMWMRMQGNVSFTHSPCGYQTQA